MSTDSYPENLPPLLRPLWDDTVGIHKGDPAVFKDWVNRLNASW